jgi:gamma-glutamyl-gamma-aminobutyrate hydrolase PuuD
VTLPIIALAPCSKQHDYEESIRRAGGDVRILDYARDVPADVIKAVDGILLPGGGDVQPSIYGAEPHSTFDAAETGRDAYELELTRRAVEADLPLLAICRGIQVLNVARGGTLVQDIPDELRDSPITPCASLPTPSPTTCGLPKAACSSGCSPSGSRAIPVRSTAVITRR